ncbi:MAG: hypothetical protein JSR21_17175 [Proteobacteria bacterium]|nr:hypothetical protein [Pseudomonadota bacterium]
MSSAASPSPAPDEPAAKRWSARRLLRLLVRLGDLGGALQVRIGELAKRTPERVAPNLDAVALDRRVGDAWRRLIGLMARIEMRIARQRGSARANAPGAAEKRRQAARARVEAKARFARETGLDPRYAPLKRPLGQEPPPRRSDTYRFREGWASLIEGETDRAVLIQASREFADAAREIGDEPAALQIEALAREVLAEMAEAEAAHAARGFRFTRDDPGFGPAFPFPFPFPDPFASPPPAHDTG